MSLQLIEGGAGTGKTTMVIDRLGHLLNASPLAEHQRVLALTKMHGSRRRVRERLMGVSGLYGRFESATIDSFSTRIVHRWRSLARVLVGSEIPTEFDAICQLAGQLLEVDYIQKWVASSFPIVIVDELQDSRGGQLRVLKGLCAQCECIAAGDAFQYLNADGACESIDWARGKGLPTVLDTIYRTTNDGLLQAANAFRTGQSVIMAGGFSIKGVPAFQLGAWEVAKQINSWQNRGTIAIITPVRAAISPFVHKVIERVNKASIGKKLRIGPFKISWETPQSEQIERICNDIGLSDNDDQLVRVNSLLLDGAGVISGVREKLIRYNRLLGRKEFSVGEIRSVVNEVVHQSRHYARNGESRLMALTVHQAKNREFDFVILLWPYQVGGNEEHKRRLAYNAITRARYAAHVVVEGVSRVSQSPFI